ncbi:hypothetical protein KR009_010850 [Drosophila setifemur]|nr:hypothetical protein KR009_010850 [Drosophila setifemur]
MQPKENEDLCLIAIGVLLHLGSFSISSALNSTAGVLLPNAASTLMALTLHGTLTRWRPCWSRAPGLSPSQGLLLLLLEQMAVVFAVELLLIHAWVPMVIGLIKVYEDFVQSLLACRNEYLLSHFPRSVSWLNNEGFYYARFLMALTLALAIASFQHWISIRVRPAGRRPAARTSAEKSTSTIHISIPHKTAQGNTQQFIDLRLEEFSTC